MLAIYIVCVRCSKHTYRMKPCLCVENVVQDIIVGKADSLSVIVQNWLQFRDHVDHQSHIAKLGAEVVLEVTVKLSNHML